MANIVFFFILKALFVLKIFEFLSWIFGHLEKMAWLDVNFKIYDVTTWLRNNHDADIAQRLKKSGNQAMKFGHLIEYNKWNFFSWKIMQKKRHGD